MVADRLADETADLAAVLLRAVVQETDVERDVPHAPRGKLVAGEPANVSHRPLDLGALRAVEGGLVWPIPPVIACLLGVQEGDQELQPVGSRLSQPDESQLA